MQEIGAVVIQERAQLCRQMRGPGNGDDDRRRQEHQVQPVVVLRGEPAQDNGHLRDAEVADQDPQRQQDIRREQRDASLEHHKADHKPELEDRPNLEQGREILAIEKHVCGDEDRIGDQSKIVQHHKAFCGKLTAPILIVF